ncbi:MAG: PLP-dependent aminotransferase family protein [Clostridia bacterium]|nr:PLP-dependent aminotransferase family protein [Clostridia bacterium]
MKNKYHQVVIHIKQQIQDKSLKPGSKAPSIREICEIFGCNKATAIRAYEELQKEHVIFSVPKSGFYVVERDTEPKRQDDSVIDFLTACPDEELLPYQEFQHSINQAIKVYKDHMFSYSDVQGLPTLRKVMKDHLRDSQIFCGIDQIFITSGSQQALYILSKMSFPNGKRNVLIEQPTYYGMIKALELNQITAIGIERKADGYDMDRLESIFRSNDIKFFYMIPRFHNPTSFSLQADQRKQILKLAQKYDVYIIEDDYLAELETNSKMDPMFAMEPSNRVAYIKSFSKTLLPGLRLGVAVLPQLLINSFYSHKACCDLLTNTLSQGALEIYLKSGMYDNHLKHIRSFYCDQMKTLKNAIEGEPTLKNCGSVPETGFFVCLELPENIRARALEEALKMKKVYLTSIDRVFLPGFEKSNLIRLCVCRVKKQQIHRGIRLLAEVLEKETGDTCTLKQTNVNSFF